MFELATTLHPSSGYPLSHASLFQPSDWYSITLADLKNIGAPSTLCKAELAEALQERYPDFKWEKVFLFKGRFGQQRRLQHLLTELFPVSIPFSCKFLSSIST